MVSAMITFLNRPIPNMVMPIAIRVGENALSSRPDICANISRWSRSGPAVTQGKKPAKSAYFAKFTLQA